MTPVTYGTTEWDRLWRRFWRKVRVTSVARDAGCWEWTGKVYKLRGSYGAVRINGRDFRAHRGAYELAIGPIPPKHLICHRCDNPRCVRPSHLWADTQRQNMRDMVEKRRDWHARWRDRAAERQHAETFKQLVAA